MTFFSALSHALTTKQTRLCVGIDPPLPSQQNIFQPEFIHKQNSYNYLYQFSAAMIEACYQHVAIVKFQSAYFEAHGHEGFRALEHSVQYAKKHNLIVILDAKRGDIASTMTAYCDASFDRIGADCLTITPWMGWDVIEPTIHYMQQGKAIFIVWLTSNTSSKTVQNAQLNQVQLSHANFVLDELLKSLEARQIQHNCGVVLGNNRIQDVAEHLLIKLKNHAILIPGVGAQGGTISPPLIHFLRQNPAAIINVSRGLYSTKSDSYTEAPASWQDFQRCVNDNTVRLAQELRIF